MWFEQIEYPIVLFLPSLLLVIRHSADADRADPYAAHTVMALFRITRRSVWQADTRFAIAPGANFLDRDHPEHPFSRDLIE